jgi:acyl-CoA dehydrogenase
MGFIEETGVAQYYRDARITAIYEGTTGIQALDLIGRKTASEGGATARALLAEVRGTAAALKADGATEPLGQNLEQSAAEAEQCVALILETFGRDPKIAAVGAVAFLKLMGVLLGGWMMGRAALIAKDKLQEQDADVDFLNAKRATATFYGAHILPQVASYAETILHGADSVLSFDLAAF